MELAESWLGFRRIDLGLGEAGLPTPHVCALSGSWLYYSLKGVVLIVSFREMVEWPMHGITVLVHYNTHLGLVTQGAPDFHNSSIR